MKNDKQNAFRKNNDYESIYMHISLTVHINNKIALELDSADKDRDFITITEATQYFIKELVNALTEAENDTERDIYTRTLNALVNEKFYCMRTLEESADDCAIASIFIDIYE